MRIDKDNIKIILILLVVCLSLGYAYINSDLNINGTAQVKHANWDIHWANIQVSSESVSASTPTISSGTTVTYSVTLPTPGNFYEFTVDAVNGGQIDAMIDTIDSKLNNNPITNLPAYLNYSVTYSDGVPLEQNHLLAANTTEKYKVKLEYRTDITESQLPTTNQTLTLSFTVTYRQATEDAVAVDHSFSGHSWETIINNVRDGNTDMYNIGDTKGVYIGSFGTHPVRIANKSTPAECATPGFSQTSCGFVLEFTNIIINHSMNSTSTNVGGWLSSEMRSFVNNDIYNSFPTELKSGIIDTMVVSGHGSNDTNNFVTTDKVYLLSPKEVYNYGTNDTSASFTRQLDYYNSYGVSNSNCSQAKKKIGFSKQLWWLRSANQNYNTGFFDVEEDGSIISNGESVCMDGVSPAFRIG